MKYYFLIFILFFAFSSITAEWISFSQNVDRQLFEFSSFGLGNTDLEFNLDGFEKTIVNESGREFEHIDYQNEGKFLDFGMPDLPRFTRMIAIPDQGNVNFSINGFEKEIITDINVYPIQELRSDSKPYDPEFQLNEVFYNGRGVFPEHLVEISEPKILRDIRLVAVTINPFQYDPASEELKIYRNISVSFSSDQTIRGKNAKLDSRKLSRSFEPIYQAVIENYDQIIRNTDDGYQIPCYLIIYKNDAAVLSTLEYLEDWKKQKGFEVHLVSTAQTGTSTTSIKNYIQNAYDTWENPPEFVAIAGDHSGSYGVPTYFETVSGYGGEGDHPYSQLEGNDILADVILGRLSFESITELQTMVYKILNYEQQPFMGNTDWYTHAVMVGDPSSSGPSCPFTKQSIRETMHYYNPNFTFAEAYSGSYSSVMINALNTGVSYFNYRGYIGMSGFSNNNITSLNNHLMLPFAVFMTCGTGSFASGTSRSEAFLRAGSVNSPKGAIAAIGTATSGTHTTFNNCTDAGTYYGVFVDNIYNPGGALLRGKLHLYNSFPGNPSNRVTIFSHWNTLIGDPGIELWTDVPQPMNVSYEPTVNLGANFLQVTVTENLGEPIENAWVTALEETSLFVERAYTNSDGVAFIPLSEVTLGTVNLTVTHHNNIPHLGTFEVISAPVFVNVNVVLIDDDNNGASSGNDDELINPGESIELQVGLKNFGSQTANQVTASVASNTDFITITDAEEDFGNIAANNTNFCNDSYKFSVADNVLGGNAIQLDMLIEDNAGTQWDDHIFLPVNGANLDVDDYTIIDANGILNPGDTVELVVSLFNAGSAEAVNLEGQLSCGNDYITLIDSIAAFEDIAAGQTGDNDASRFEFSADSHSINGSQMEFHLTLTNPDGFEQNLTFLIDIGILTVQDPLGPDDYGYYAYDSGDDTYDLHPIYNWIEIDPAYGGSGTVIPLYDNGDDGDVADVTMPFSFNFYGVNYNMISVCSNGWIAPGGSDQASFMNTQIPAPQGPSPMIAPFWDDLKTSGGSVCYYHDISEHAFIIEWSRLHTDWTGDEETFQVLIYDPAVYPTPSGDAEIVFQYKEIANTSTGNYSGYGIEHGQYCTIGLEDHTAAGGLEYSYNNTYPTAAAALQDEMAIKFTTMGGGAQSPPIINLNPASLEFILEPEATDDLTFQITNSGEANLIYDLQKSYDNSTDDNSRGHGGPDGFGYEWFDNYEPNGPVYNWRDISVVGTEITFSDPNQGTDLIPIGFNFYFYGTYYSDFRINPNGWIGFGDDLDVSNNLSLPHPYGPKPAILPFWDNLDPISGGSVMYYSTPDSLVVWYDDVDHAAGNYSGTYDFQLILYTDGDMLLQYREMTGDTNSATIGIQNEAGNMALQLTYNGNFVEDQYAVIIKKIADWMEINPTYGYLEQGESIDITVTANSSGLVNGEFLGSVVITSNDPNQTVLELPVSMLISPDFPHLEIPVDYLDFGAVDLGASKSDTLHINNSGTVELVISDISTNEAEFTVDSSSMNIPAGQSQELIVTFQPQSLGNYDDVLTLISNDPIHPEVEIELSGVCENITNTEDLLPVVTKLQGNYPNPFNPITTIKYSLAESGEVSVIIYNIKGEKVKILLADHQQPGNYKLEWNGTDSNEKPVGSGVYFYQFQTNSHNEVNKMLLLK